jgi:AcrR family transcriptional regulator
MLQGDALLSKRVPGETKRRIIEATWELMNQEDRQEDTFSARRLADKVGVTAGRVLQYYKTLDDLILDTFSHHYLPKLNDVMANAQNNQASMPWRQKLDCNMVIWTDLYFAHKQISRRAMAFSWRFHENTRAQYAAFNAALFDAIHVCVQDPHEPLPNDLLHLFGRSWYRNVLQDVRLGFQMQWTAQRAAEELKAHVHLLADGVDARRGLLKTV